MKSCAKCGNRQVSKHHSLPKCFYYGKGGIVYLCRGKGTQECHNKIENLYQIAERKSGTFACACGRKRLTASEYYEILSKFLSK